MIPFLPYLFTQHGNILLYIITPILGVGIGYVIHSFLHKSHMTFAREFIVELIFATGVGIVSIITWGFFFFVQLATRSLKDAELSSGAQGLFVLFPVSTVNIILFLVLAFVSVNLPFVLVINRFKEKQLFFWYFIPAFLFLIVFLVVLLLIENVAMGLL